MTRQQAEFVVRLSVMWLLVGSAEASGARETERLMWWNTRGLAVAGTVAAGFHFTMMALLKLGAVDAALTEKAPVAGALMELTGSAKALHVLRGWFRARGYGLRVLTGSRSDDGTTRNGVAVFFRRDRLRFAASDSAKNGATREEDRLLRVKLRRKDGSELEIMAWHGMHTDVGFGRQLTALEEVASTGESGVVLADVNRRVCRNHSSSGAALSWSDKRWKAACGHRCACCPNEDGDEDTSGLRLVAAFDESTSAATRRAVVSGKEEWSLIDRAITYGSEVGRWEVEEVYWMQTAQHSERMLSDHGAVILAGSGARSLEEVEDRWRAPVRGWKQCDNARFAALAAGVAARVREEGGSEKEILQRIDAEFVDIADVVEQERLDRKESRGTMDAKGLLGLWRWRLKGLIAMKEAKWMVFQVAWLRHRRNTLKGLLLSCERNGVDAEETWSRLRRRCRREVAFCGAMVDTAARVAKRFLDRALRLEQVEDLQLRAKLARDMMRGSSAPAEKVGVVAIGDDPEKGFVHRPQDVRAEIARIGRMAQESYRDENPSPDGAFEALVKKFMEPFEELRAPDGESFDLQKLLVYEMFEDELFGYARNKAVGAKVNGAASSLELLRRLPRQDLVVYFECAKECVVRRRVPDSWKQMVYTLLKKKHGDQRKVRKMREIALMDQVLKLMLKCVKRLTFDRMVGRTGEDNHGWVPGHGALNAALVLDCVLGQIRELKESIFLLYLDLAKFFPSIKRKARTVAEYLIGLPDEVALLSVEIWREMMAKFDTAHGQSDGFDILGGDLMGCILSPSHARSLLSSVSVAIAAVSSGVKIWGCEKEARRLAQVMMADDWCGFNNTEESLQAQWKVWVDWSLASGSPIGVEDLDKTVVSAARWDGSRWVDVEVTLEVPQGPGGMSGLPRKVPQLAWNKFYAHMGVPRSIGGKRSALREKLRKGVLRFMAKCRRLRLDMTQHVTCANALKGAFVGYYAAAAGLTFGEAEAIERLWRVTLRACFKLRRDTPVAAFYGGKAGAIGDSWGGRHCFGDAVAALRLTYTRALASPVDSCERAIVRSALARRCRFWGCTVDPTVWLGSIAHRQAALMIEKEMEKGSFRGEASDFFIWYEALLAPIDDTIREERRRKGAVVGPERQSLSMEHRGDRWGEALGGGRQHGAWQRGSSRLLCDTVEIGMAAVLVNAGVVRVEHVCARGVRGPRLLSFNEMVERWRLPRTAACLEAYKVLREEVRESKVALEATGTIPLTARQLHDGVRRIEGAFCGDRGWPCGETVKCGGGSDAFRDLLMAARSGDAQASRAGWEEALQASYGDVERKRAVEWWEGAPTDTDKYTGVRLVTVWPKADHRWGGDVKEYGGLYRARVSEGRKEELRREVTRWALDDRGGVLVDGRAPDDQDCERHPGLGLLWQSSEFVMEKGGSVDLAVEGERWPAGQWRVNVNASRRFAQEIGKLHVEYDFDYACATDGGRQVGEDGVARAGRAGLRHDGEVEGGAMDAEVVARSSYETEMQALIDMAKALPQDARVLFVIDARSPVQALIRFRMCHVSKRMDYFEDDMLDALLIELERLHLAVFYWVRGHSGVAPNEAADWLATAALEEEPETARAPWKRHASVSFKAECAQYKWSAERASRWVTARLRSWSTRSEWKASTDVDLSWKGLGVDASARRLHACARMQRALPGDYWKRQAGGVLLEGKFVCGCGTGGWMSAAHWLFECKECPAQARRTLLAAKARSLEERARLENKNVVQPQLVALVAALEEREAIEEDRRDGDRRMAFRALMGLFSEPEVLSRGVRKEMELLTAAVADSLQAASRMWSARQEEVVEALKKEGLIRKYGRRWQWRARLYGAWTRVERSKARSLGNKSDWDAAAREWRAVVTVRIAARRCRRIGARQARSQWAAWLAMMEERVAFCKRRGTGKRSAAKAVAAGKRKQKLLMAEAERARFRGMLCLAPGNRAVGSPKLAPGLRDVQVTFCKRRRRQWKRSGGRRKVKKGGGKGRRKQPESRKNRKGGGGKGRRAKRRIQWDDMSEEEEGSEADDEDEEGAPAGSVQDEASGGKEGGVPRVAPVPDQRVRVYWTEEEVWFRARVVSVEGAAMTVEYTHVGEGWEREVHDWRRVTWEAWTPASVPDPAEEDYRLEVWLGEVDSEARDASVRGVGSEGGRDARRRRREERARGEGQKRQRAAVGCTGSDREQEVQGVGGAGEDVQREGEGEEDAALEELEVNRAVRSKGTEVMRPKTVVGKLWQLLRLRVRKGEDGWSRREVYVMAARGGLKPTVRVSQALRELEGWNILMLVDDEVHWLESEETVATETYTQMAVKREREEPEDGRGLVKARRMGGLGCAEGGPNGDEVVDVNGGAFDGGDDADMLMPGEPLRDGPGELGGGSTRKRKGDDRDDQLDGD